MFRKEEKVDHGSCGVLRRGSWGRHSGKGASEPRPRIEGAIPHGRDRDETQVVGHLYFALGLKRRKC